MNAAVRLTPQQLVYRLGCLAAAVSITGCRGDTGGARILAELERDRVPSLTAGEPHQRPPESTSPLPSGLLTLSDLIAAAEARNPQLAAARSSVGVAAGQVWQASLYPNPSIGMTAEEMPLNDGFGGGKTVAEIAQPIILGPRRRNAVTAAEAQQAVRRAEVEAVRRSLLGEVALLHAHLLALRGERQLTTELLALARQAVDTARTRLEGGAATESEVILPEIEVYELESASSRVDRELAATEKRLGLLLNTDPVAADQLSGELDQDPEGVDIEALEDVVRRTHPALTVADRKIEAAAAELNQTRAERIPDVEVQAGLGYSGEGEEGIFELGVGMEIPLWDRRQGHILSARYEIIRLHEQRRAQENALLSELAAVHGEYEAARAQLRVLREQIVPRAERGFEQMADAYRAGNTTFSALLEAQRALMEARRALIDLARDAAAARARLIQIAGADLLAAAPDTGSVDTGGPITQPTTVPAGRAEEIE